MWLRVLRRAPEAVRLAICPEMCGFGARLMYCLSVYDPGFLHQKTVEAVTTDEGPEQ